MPSVIDVAKHANVSPSTVSRYIRNATNISEEKIKRIKNAIKELGYVPNFNASSLKRNSSNLVGIILPSEHNLFFVQLVNKLNKAIQPDKKLIVLYAENFEEVKANIITLLSLKASAILFVAEQKSSTVKSLTLTNDCYPLQLFVDSFPEFDSIIINDSLGTYLAVKSLLENNHRRILLIDHNNDVYTQRKKGFTDAFTEAGLTVDEASFLGMEQNSNHKEKIIERIRSFKPTAIICVTEIMSQELCQILSENNISVPNDVSLIVYDDSVWAQLSNITAVCQPLDDVVSNIKEFLDTRTHKTEKLTDVKKLILDPFVLNRKSIKNYEG